jgi:hypothetical protein
LAPEKSADEIGEGKQKRVRKRKDRKKTADKTQSENTGNELKPVLKENRNVNTRPKAFSLKDKP